MGKFSNALGIWDFTVSEEEYELKPTMDDVRTFRKLITNDDLRKNKSRLFDSFVDYMTELLSKGYPTEDKSEIKMFVELNVNQLFEEAMVAFRWTTREDLLESKKEALGKLKKSMSSV